MDKKSGKSKNIHCVNHYIQRIIRKKHQIFFIFRLFKNDESSIVYIFNCILENPFSITPDQKQFRVIKVSPIGVENIFNVCKLTGMKKIDLDQFFA